MSNIPKPENVDDCHTEAKILNNYFKNARNEIIDTDIEIKQAERIIAVKELVRAKAELTINIITGKTKLSDIVPIMPKSWENDPKLKSRYNNLTEAIQSNPQWWIKRKDEIELQDEGINFKKLHFILDLDELPGTKNWDELKNMMVNIPDLREFRIISSFINSAGCENSLPLEKFLGLSANLYWSSTEFDSNRAFKMLFTNYAIDIVDSKENSLNIKTVKRY